MKIRRVLQPLIRWWNMIRVAKSLHKIPRLSPAKLPSQLERPEPETEDT